MAPTDQVAGEQAARFDTLIADTADRFGLGAKAGPLVREVLNMIMGSPGGVSGFIKKFEQAGTLGRLYQTYTSAGGHCLFNAAEALAMYDVLMTWISTGTAPTDQQTQAACDKYRAGVGGTCRFNFTFQPAALETRVYMR